MDSKSSKKTPNEQKQSGRSLKKNIALAAIAASLGISLGVPVGDVFAGNFGETQPGYSNQYKRPDSNQLKINQRQSSQWKGQSNQMKLNSTGQSNQMEAQ